MTSCVYAKYASLYYAYNGNVSIIYIAYSDNRNCSYRKPIRKSNTGNIFHNNLA